MNTNINNITPFIALAIWCDGEYNDAEKEMTKKLANIYNFDELTFISSAEKEINLISAMSGEELDGYLRKTAENVNPNDVGMIFMGVLKIIASDGKFVKNEARNLCLLADILKISQDDVIMIIAGMFEENPDIALFMD